MNNNHESGIKVRSHGEYAAKTAIGLAALHFLIPPLLCVMGVLFLILGAICLAPCILLDIFTHNTRAIHDPHTARLVGDLIILLGISGVVNWIYWSFRGCRKIIRWFLDHSRMQYVNGYRGPLGRS